MQANDKRALQGFRYIVEFLDRHPVEVVVADLKRQRDALADIVIRMTARAERRVEGAGEARGTTQKLRGQRRRLEFEFFAPVRRLTGELAASNESLREVLHVPRQTDVVSQLNLARGVAAAAREHAAAFTAAGLVPNYAEQLSALVKEIEETLSLRTRRMVEVTGAGTGVKEDARRGRSIVQLLDTLIRGI